MSLFKVTVECWQKKGRPSKRSFIVEANSLQAAWDSAPGIAESTAAIGPQWTAFLPRAAVSVKFPLELP